MPSRGISRNPIGLNKKISKKFFTRNSPTGYVYKKGNKKRPCH